MVEVEDKRQEMVERLKKTAILAAQMSDTLLEIRKSALVLADSLGAMVTSEELVTISEQLAAPERSDVVYTFPCEGKIKEFKVTVAMISEYQSLYSQMDVDFEIRRMLTWLKANPTKKKTARGMPRFIDAWLSRAQNNGRYQQRVQLQLMRPAELAPYQSEGYGSWDEWKASLRHSLSGDDLERALFQVEERRRKWEDR